MYTQKGDTMKITQGISLLLLLALLSFTAGCDERVSLPRDIETGVRLYAYGKVTDLAGDAVMDARVAIYYKYDEMSMDPPVRECLTDSLGTYTIQYFATGVVLPGMSAQLNAENYQVVISKPGFLPAVGTFQNEHFEYVVTLSPEHVIENDMPEKSEEENAQEE